MLLLERDELAVMLHITVGSGPAVANLL
jgi:hypothetical protein